MLLRELCDRNASLSFSLQHWLGIPDVIDLYYRDQISQAVGRNRGIRGDDKNLKTVVITSDRLAPSSFFSSPAPEECVSEEQEDTSGFSEQEEMPEFEIYLGAVLNIDTVTGGHLYGEQQENPVP